MSATSNERMYRVVTAVGRDRSGLVERVSTVIHELGGNLEDSRMAILGGEFALVLLYSALEPQTSRIETELCQLESTLGLTVSVRNTAPPSEQVHFQSYQLRVNGFDRSGIVAHVSAVLSRHEVNVAALDSNVRFAPLSGTPLFQLRARLQVPSSVGLSRLREALSELCDQESLDYQLDADV